MFKGFYANKLLEDGNIATAMNGNFHHGYTVMHISGLDNPHLEGADLLLDATLKTLKNYKDELKNNKCVNVHLEWGLNEDRTQYTYCKVLSVN